MQILKLTVFCFKTHLCFQELCFSQKDHTMGKHLQRSKRADHLKFSKKYVVS